MQEITDNEQAIRFFVIRFDAEVVFITTFLIQINKMLPLFNFSIKVFARIDTFNYKICENMYGGL